MRIKWNLITTIAVAILVMIALPAAAQVSSSKPLSVKDSTNHTIVLPEPARRIVSLSPAVTETLFAIGAGERVVGVTTYCNYPAATLSIPKIGGFSAKTMAVEKVVALNTDLVVRAGAIHQSLAESLARLNIPVFVYDPTNIENIIRDMRALGVLTGMERGAESVELTMRTTLDVVGKILAPIKSADRPTVFWEIYDEPLMTAGASTFQHAIVEAAGGRDIFSDLPGAWPRVSAEEVIRREPAYIVGADDHGDKMSVAQVADRPGWAQIPAVKDKKIFLVPADLVSRPSPRIVEGVLAVAKVLYPGLFR